MSGLLVLLLLGFTAVSECHDGAGVDTFRITTIINEPYVMYSDEETEDGEKKFKGYLIDLWELLNKKLKFKDYVITVVADGKYGTYNEDTGKWIGMIGEIIDGKADAALAPMIITQPREEVVHFTEPYVNINTAVLIKKSLNIKTVQDLLESEIAYGCVSPSNTNELLKSSSNSVVHQLFHNMKENDPSVFVQSNKQGTTKVLNEDYAFIGESDTLEYFMATHDELMTFNIDEIPERGFGIALPTDSGFTGHLSDAIVELKDNGTMDKLYVKWWQEYPLTSGASRVTNLHFLITIASLLAVCFYKL